MNMDREMSILRKFEWLMLLMMFLIPIAASNSQNCVLDIGILGQAGFFNSIAQSGAVPAGVICTFESLLFLYAIFAVGGCSQEKLYKSAFC